MDQAQDQDQALHLLQASQIVLSKTEVQQFVEAQKKNEDLHKLVASTNEEL